MTVAFGFRIILSAATAHEKSKQKTEEKRQNIQCSRQTMRCMTLQCVFTRLEHRSSAESTPRFSRLLTQTLQNMPVYSMTGFAATPEATQQHESNNAGQKPPAVPLQFELRSVNSRFLDLHFKLPDSLRSHEPLLRQLVRGCLARGKVEIRARIAATPSQPQQTGSLFDTQLLTDVLEQCETAQQTVLRHMPDALPLRVVDVLQYAQPLTGGEPDAAKSPTEEAVREAMLAALQTLQATRAREGQALAQLMLKIIMTLRQLTQQAEPLIPALIEQQRQRFLTRWGEALQETAATSAPVTATARQGSEAQQRALSEATAYALRIDVAEELNRLQLHLSEIERVLQTGTAPITAAATSGRPAGVGKRLEFLIQELHREANTLGSKSGTAELSAISVDMKVHIEQLREQVQNIE